MRRFVFGVLFALAFVGSAFAQQGGGVVMKGPVTPGQCATWFATNILQGAACGGGTAGSIAIGTTTTTGGTNTRILFDDNGLVGEDGGLTYVKGTATVTAGLSTLAGHFVLSGPSVNTSTPANIVFNADTSPSPGDSGGTGAFAYKLGLYPSLYGFGIAAGELFGVIPSSAMYSFYTTTGGVNTLSAAINAAGLALASGKVLQLGNAVVNGVPVSNGTVTMKDSAGVTVQVLVVHP